MDGIDNLEDSIQVVTPNEIYRPSEVPVGNVYTESYPQFNNVNPFEMQPVTPEPSKMNFTPVINVVTGSNNTIDSVPVAPVQTVEPANNNTIETLPVVSTFSENGGSSKTIQNNIQTFTSNNNNNDEVDFTKGLLIKKV
jgi:hypothetical protein